GGAARTEPRTQPHRPGRVDGPGPFAAGRPPDGPTGPRNRPVGRRLDGRAPLAGPGIAAAAPGRVAGPRHRPAGAGRRAASAGPERTRRLGPCQRLARPGPLRAPRSADQPEPGVVLRERPGARSVPGVARLAPGRPVDPARTVAEPARPCRGGA